MVLPTPNPYIDIKTPSIFYSKINETFKFHEMNRKILRIVSLKSNPFESGKIQFFFLLQHIHVIRMKNKKKKSWIRMDPVGHRGFKSRRNNYNYNFLTIKSWCIKKCKYYRNAGKVVYVYVPQSVYYVLRRDSSNDPKPRKDKPSPRWVV
jgi:hypothetical protein